MKYCSKCGNVMADEDVYCAKCGAKSNESSSSYNEYNQDNNSKWGDINTPINKSDEIMLIKLFQILQVVAMGFAIIPLFWTIPMTLHLFRKLDNKEKISVEFKVCNTIFAGFISGIILLCDNDL